MVIIHSSKHEFYFHLLTLTLIFILILTSTFITVKEWGGWGVDTPIILGCITLMILFAYAMYISSTFHYIKHPRDEPGNPDLHRPFFNLTGFSSKEYEQVPPAYNNETDDNA